MTSPSPEFEHSPTLQQSEERFRLLVESITDYAIFMLDPTGHIVSWNAGARRLKGYEPPEIVGRHFSVFYPDEARKAGWPEYELKQAAAEGRFEDEGWRLRKDGTRFWASVVITAVRDNERRLTGFAKVTRDLTESRKAEALEESERRMSEFLAMLSHELRNPLAPIRTMIDLFKSREIQDPQLKLIRDVIDNQVTHLTRVVSDLLDVTRIKHGMIAVRREPLELATVVVQALQAVRPLIAAKHHTLHTDNLGHSLWVDGDLVRLSQVLVNLLNNAAVYTPPGGEICLDIDRDGDKVRISVSDTGRGIEAESREDIFMFFRRSKHSSESSDGLGIGLGLAKRLVELHDGSIEVRSEGVGRGSEFIVTLPLLPQSVIAAPAFGSIAGDKAAQLRIVVVDDNRDFAESLSMLLQTLGHVTLTAHDGEEALAAAREFRADVVFLDIGLPKLDGYEVARRLRADPERRYALVALTGWGQDEDKQRTTDAGFDHHLVKPVELEVLQQVLESSRTQAFCR